MSESYLQRSYFDPAHDNPVMFVVGHTFGVFQYFFGQLAVGIAVGIVFLVGVVLLLRGKGLPPESNQEMIQRLRAGWEYFCSSPLPLPAASSLAHLYPYGGTRHVAFLIIPAVAGVSVAIACLATRKMGSRTCHRCPHPRGLHRLRQTASAPDGARRSKPEPHGRCHRFCPREY